MNTPTRAQYLFLKMVSHRGTERQQGQAVDGVAWTTQAVAEKRGWVTTRPGNVNAWERWYVITEDGKAAIEAYRKENVK